MDGASRAVFITCTFPRLEFPFILFAPQPEVEAVLRDRLRELEVDVEWGCQLTELAQHGDRVECRVHRSKGTAASIVAKYVAGCDGPDSLVRTLIGARFQGGDYRRAIVIGDADPTDDLESSTAHAFLRRAGILFSFPLPSGGWRIIAPDMEAEGDLIKAVSRHTGGSVRLANVHWVKSIRPQHRLASSYGVGRVFLAGDAAHVHSPAGAQGMNTGIQDAANLGWKLAIVLRGGPDTLLSSYEVERRPVAKKVLRLTGIAHAFEISDALPFRIGRALGGTTGGRPCATPAEACFSCRPGRIGIGHWISTRCRGRCRRAPPRISSRKPIGGFATDGRATDTSPWVDRRRQVSISSSSTDKSMTIRAKTSRRIMRAL